MMQQHSIGVTSHARGHRSAFTLLELTVVIAVVSILLAISLPALQHARESSRVLQCRNNLRQLALGMHNFASIHGHFPPGYLGPPAEDMKDDGLNDQWSGHLGFILPQLEQSALYNRFGPENWDVTRRVGPPWYYSLPDWDSASTANLSVLQCPSATLDGFLPVVLTTRRSAVQLSEQPSAHGATSYLGCAGTDGFYSIDRRERDGVFVSRRVCRAADISDGLSSTILLGEVVGYSTANDWSTNDARHSFMCGGVFADAIQRQPIDVPIGPTSALIFRSQHDAVVNIAMADGSVRGLSELIDLIVLHGLAGKADGEVTSEF